MKKAKITKQDVINARQILDQYLPGWQIEGEGLKTITAPDQDGVICNFGSGVTDDDAIVNVCNFVRHRIFDLGESLF